MTNVSQFWFPAKSEDGCRPILKRPIVKMTPTNLDKQSHYKAANLSLDTGEHERKQDNIELILTGKRVCNIHTFVHILFIIKMLNCKTIRVC